MNVRAHSRPSIEGIGPLGFQRETQMDTNTQEHKTIQLTDTDLDDVAGGEPMMQACMWTNSFCLTVVASPSNHTWNLNHT
jgi:hypothetical protein